MILDKEAADRVNKQNIKKEENKNIRDVQKRNPEMSFEEAQKFAKETTKSAIKAQTQYPEYKKIIPKKV